MKNASFIVTLVFAVASGLGIGMIAFNATGPAQPVPAVTTTAGDGNTAPSGAPSPSATAPAPSDADIPPPPASAEDSFGAPRSDTQVTPGAPGSANPEVLM